MIYVSMQLSQRQQEIYEAMEMCNKTGGVMIPLKEVYNIESAVEKFNIIEIPSVVVMNREGVIVSMDGIVDMKSCGMQKNTLKKKWLEKSKDKLV